MANICFQPITAIFFLQIKMAIFVIPAKMAILGGGGANPDYNQ